MSYFLRNGSKGTRQPPDPKTKTKVAVQHGNKLVSADFFHVIIVSTPGGRTICNSLHFQEGDSERNWEHPESKATKVC